MRSSVTVVAALVLTVFALASGLDNGLARTPPMGWLSWAKFFCQIDCVHHPTSCINENLYLQMADRLVEDGFRDLGYNQVNIDDCWLSKERDSSGKLQPDPTRFPHGIKYMAEYMHKKGLKLGIYEDYGTKTCAGYPGILGHMQLDAQTFASWDVDMLKLDGCNADPRTMDKGYPEMEQYLNHTGRPIIYSCSWPDYIRAELHKQPNYTLVAQNCNLWRNFNDISATWDSISSIITYYTQNQDILIPHNGPGAWNDPDMIVVGQPSITIDQAKVQMSLWSIWSSPLLMSNDLRNLAPGHKEILQNSDVIAINQDKYGIMGARKATVGGVDIYVKPISPMKGKEYSYAVAMLNMSKTSKFSAAFTPAFIGMQNPKGYHVTDLWTGKDYGIINVNDTLTASVNTTGVVFIKAIAQ